MSQKVSVGGWLAASVAPGEGIESQLEGGVREIERV